MDTTGPSAPFDSLSSAQVITKLWQHLKPRRKIQVILSLALMITSGLAEILCIGLIVPFLSILSDPLAYSERPEIQKYALHIVPSGHSSLLFAITIAFSVVTIVAAILRLSNVWINNHLAAVIGSDLSCEAYRRTLYQPFSVHLTRNSSEVITTATTEVGLMVASINMVLQMAANGILAVAVLTGLMWVDRGITLLSVALFIIAYTMFGRTVQSRLKGNSRLISVATEQQIKALQEGLGSIRDVILDGSQSIYVAKYRHSDFTQRWLVAQNQFLGTFPRFAFEALGLIIISFIGLLLSLKDSTPVLPLLGTLALGAQRLLPALQQVYWGWAGIKGHNQALNNVLVLIDQEIPEIPQNLHPIQLHEQICFQEVSFRYKNSGPEVLNKISLVIKRGDRIGILGKSGCGKSTFLDLLMGLQAPSSGIVTIDQQEVFGSRNYSHLVAWRSTVSHVPQSIFLADSTIYENIAFGVPKDKICLAKVIDCAKRSELLDFIESLPRKFDTIIGERGICLSGGQRQRIAIARALYKEASVLVLDEATSALDVETEARVIKNIMDSREGLTIIIVSHRPDTIADCNKVLCVEGGNITYACG